MKKYLQEFWSILFLASIFIILFYKVIFLGQVFYDGDNFHLNIPEKYFFVQQILQGHLPLWNPYLFLGTPYLADFNLGTLNPINFLYFFFPIPRALTLITIIDFFSLSVGMYLLLRSFSLKKIPSLFGAVVMSLSGMPFVLLGNMTFMQVIVYIPFLFLLSYKFCHTKIIKWFLFLVFLQFLQFISGHPQETYYTMLFISFYLFFFSPFTFWKKIIFVIFYIAFSVLLSSVQLIPFLEYVKYANRPVGNMNYSGWGGQTFSTLVTFIFPTFYGSHLDGTWWGTQQILIGFIGIPTFVVLYISIRFGKFKDKLYYLFGFILSFLLAFGKSTPLFYIFYYLVPGWKLFRAPSGILVFYTFFVAILSAYGLEYLNNNSNKFKKLGKIITSLSFIATVFSFGIYIFAGKAGFWQKEIISVRMHFHTHFLNTLLFYDANKLQQMLEGITWNICFVSVFFLLTGIIFFVFYKKKHQVLLILLLTTFSFFIVDPKAILLTSLNFYNIGKKVPNILQLVEKGNYRIISIPVDLHQKRQHLPPVDFFYKEGQDNLSVYQYDNNIERNLYQIAGYSSLVPGSFAKFIGAKDASTNVTNINFFDVTQNKLNLSSVRYIISHEPIKKYNDTSLNLVLSRSNVYFYENKNALKRAYILENPYGNNITFNTSQPDDISLSVTTKKTSHLILTDWYYPGWKAFVNDKEVSISPYLSTFQEIKVSSGVSSVKFIYDPLSFKIGIIISMITFVFWIGVFILLKNVKV